MTEDPPETFDEARKLVEMHGYVVLKRTSYKAAQERQRLAEMRAKWADENAESSSKWAHDCLAEERRLRDRVTFLATLAMSHGATIEELGQP